MISAKDFFDGHYSSVPQVAIRAFARAYCAWAYGQAFFRQHLYTFDGLYPSLEEFLREGWEARYIQYWDANDMIALLETWQRGDVSLIRDGGNYENCLKSIKAKVLLLPCKTDLYFCPEDSEVEASLLKDVKLRIIDSVWGHVAGGSADPRAVAFVTANIKEFLE